MGTNYYRIPTEDEMKKRKEKLINDVKELDISPKSIENFMCNIPFDDWTCQSVWDVFLSDIRIHLGKRSGGWKFLWNFQNKKYYSNKEELLSFIRSGRVVNEYGELIDNDEFIDMALNWGQPDGKVIDKEYIKNHQPYLDENYVDYYIDGLRISKSADFS